MVPFPNDKFSATQTESVYRQQFLKLMKIVKSSSER